MEIFWSPPMIVAYITCLLAGFFIGFENFGPASAIIAVGAIVAYLLYATGMRRWWWEA